MTLLICLPLVALIAGLAGRRWFVAVRRDIRSIESHRSNLDHLEHLGSGTTEGPAGAGSGSAHVRIVSRSATQPAQAVRPMVWARPDGRPPAARPSWHTPRSEPARSEPARSEPALSRSERARSEPARSRSERARVGAPSADERRVIVIADEALPAPGPPDPVGVPAATSQPVATGRRATASSGAPARLLAAAAGLLVVTAAAGAAVIESRSVPAGHLRSAATVHATNPAVTRPAGSARTAPPALTATSTTPTYAIYTVSAGSLQLSLTASGPCWVEIRDGSPSGPVSYVGTLAPGASHTFTTASGVWLRLGDPAGVQLRINGSAVPLPAAANPFDVTVSTE